MHGDPFVGLLILFGVLAIMRGRWRGFSPSQRRLEKEVAELRAQHSAAPPLRGPTLDQVQMLEDRVRVLERIVTDQNYSLARDIEALRDRPREKAAHEGSKP